MRNTTPFPNRLIDEIMPRLRDTELRVLCVVLRSTAGWISNRGVRKTRDWITHRQFQTRTGRSGESVSSAIDALVRQGLLEVQDKKGQFLRNPASRKSRFGKLYFSLGPLLQETQENSTPIIRVGKDEATKTNINKRKHKQKDLKVVQNDAVATSRGGGWARAGSVPAMVLVPSDPSLIADEDGPR